MLSEILRKMGQVQEMYLLLLGFQNYHQTLKLNSTLKNSNESSSKSYLTSMAYDPGIFLKVEGPELVI